VIHNVGIRLVDAFADNDNITAIIYAHLPGQDAGRAMARILYGDVSPSGRLPYTVAKQGSDYGSLLNPCQAKGSRSPQCDFTEGVNIDYRHFLARNITPQYEFGFGLTYTSFEYSDLQVDVNAIATDGSETDNAPVYANGTTQNSENDPVIVGGLASLFETVGSVSATVTNTGSVTAAEVGQLYLLIPNINATGSDSSVANTRALRGFQKVTILPNDTAKVTFELRRKDVSRWDIRRQAWVVPSGEFGVFVGKSVLDTPLRSTLTL
jgi:beta-glucosidase